MVKVTFGNNGKQAMSEPVTQWDKGQELRLYGTGLTDATVQVHFCDKTCGRTMVRLGTLMNVLEDGGYYTVQIPNELLENKYSINAFVYRITSDCGSTTHHAIIPVNERKRPEDFISEPDPTQTTLLEEALANINLANTHLVQSADAAMEEINAKADEMNKSLNVMNEDIEELDTRITNLEEIGSLATIQKKGLYAISFMVAKKNNTFDTAFGTTILSIENLGQSVKSPMFRFGASDDWFYIVWLSGTQSIEIYGIDTSVSYSIANIFVRQICTYE